MEQRNAIIGSIICFLMTIAFYFMWKSSKKENETYDDSEHPNTMLPWKGLFVTILSAIFAIILFLKAIGIEVVTKF